MQQTKQKFINLSFPPRYSAFKSKITRLYAGIHEPHRIIILFRITAAEALLYRATPLPSTVHVVNHMLNSRHAPSITPHVFPARWKEMLNSLSRSCLNWSTVTRQITARTVESHHSPITPQLSAVTFNTVRSPVCVILGSHSSEY